MRTHGRWHVLHNQTAYRELGTDQFTKRAMRRMVRQANDLGLTISFEPITAT